MPFIWSSRSIHYCTPRPARLEEPGVAALRGDRTSEGLPGPRAKHRRRAFFTSSRTLSSSVIGFPGCVGATRSYRRIGDDHTTNPTARARIVSLVVVRLRHRLPGVEVLRELRNLSCAPTHKRACRAAGAK